MGNEKPELCSSADIADALACLERLDAANLVSLSQEIDRICRVRGILGKCRTISKPVKLGSVSLGATFVYRTEEFFGAEYAGSRKPPFEGMTLKVVDFKPRYVNQIVVQSANGYQCLLPLWEVEKALKSKTQVGSEESGSTSSTASDTF
jgi:hypothetical protein